jgi:uncharacterized protein
MNLDTLTELGFPYSENVIFLFEGGSKMHGAKLEGTDDTDYYGIFLEPPHLVLGIDQYQHFIHTTGGKRGGNGPDDVDVTLYSLRKWAAQAAKGNPSFLSFLFANRPIYQTIYWGAVSIQHSKFAARNHASAFLGYAQDQLKRLYGGKGQKNIHRVALEEKFGYDTKYAMHTVRLLQECKEFLETGKMTFPRPNSDELIRIRQGEHKLSEVIEIAKALETQIQICRDYSALPKNVDRTEISHIIAKAYRDFWADRDAITTMRAT